MNFVIFDGVRVVLVFLGWIQVVVLVVFLLLFESFLSFLFIFFNVVGLFDAPDFDDSLFVSGRQVVFAELYNLLDPVFVRLRIDAVLLLRETAENDFPVVAATHDHVQTLEHGYSRNQTDVLLNAPHLREQELFLFVFFVNIDLRVPTSRSEGITFDSRQNAYRFEVVWNHALLRKQIGRAHV